MSESTPRKTLRTPNFRLLREAYAIVGGIPEGVFNLAQVFTDRGESLDCGTIACAAGWLSCHPKMQDAGDIKADRWSIMDRQSGTPIDYANAMCRVFKIDPIDADRLFAPRGEEIGYLGRAESSYTTYPTDKSLWLARVRKFLREHGQLSAQCRARGERP